MLTGCKFSDNVAIFDDIPNVDLIYYISVELPSLLTLGTAKCVILFILFYRVSRLSSKQRHHYEVIPQGSVSNCFYFLLKFILYTSK